MIYPGRVGTRFFQGERAPSPCSVSTFFCSRISHILCLFPQNAASYAQENFTKRHLHVRINLYVSVLNAASAPHKDPQGGGWTGQATDGLGDHSSPVHSV